LLLASTPALALAQDDVISTADEAKGAPSQETSDPAEVVSEAPKIAIEEEAGTKKEELVVEENPSFDTRYPNKKYIDAVLERSSHMSLGYALGRMGDGFVFGPRFDLPVTKTNWGYLQFFHYTNFGTFQKPFDPVLLLGVNFQVRTKVMLGIFRLYGGGGFFGGWRPDPACKNPLDQKDVVNAYLYEGQPVSTLRPTPQQVATNEVAARIDKKLNAIDDRCQEQMKSFTISGGGSGGIEFFAGPVRAYFIEISGGGGAQTNGIWRDTGLVLRAGNHFYF
jgi:hypothetical protein